MVCSNCGNKISKDSKFCDKCGSKAPSEHNKLKSNKKICNRCGSKISSDAVFCYKCGNNTSGVNYGETNSYDTENNNVEYNVQIDDVSKKSVENIPNQNTQQESFNSPNLNENTETTKKSNTTKIIVGSIIGIAIVSTIAVINDTIEKKESANTKTEATIEVPEEAVEVPEEAVEEVVEEVVEEPTPETTFNGIELTKIYTNEAEGMSFNYPENWKADPSLANNIGDILYFRSPTEQSLNAAMNINKMDVSVPGLDISILSDKIENGFDSDVFVVQEKIDTKIDGMDAIKLITTFGEDGIGIIYIYIINGDIYRISFYTYDERFDKDGPIFDAIMESYKISFPTERSYQEQNFDDYESSEKQALETAQKFLDTHPLMERTITGYIEYEPQYDDISTKGLYRIETKAPDGSRRAMWVDEKTGSILLSSDGMTLRDGEEVYKELFGSN